MRRSCEEGLCICLIFFFGPSKFSPATRRTNLFGLAEMPRRSPVVIFFPAHFGRHARNGRGARAR